MNEGLQKFENLMKTDEAFQNKLKTALEAYTGEQTPKAAFEGVFVPLAKEYGITASFEEFQEYIKRIPMQERELSDEEINQVAGGSKVSGFGAEACWAVGAGVGSTEDGSTCLVIGAGVGAGACAGSGSAN